MAERAAEMNEYLIKTLGLTPLECDEIYMRNENCQKQTQLSGKYPKIRVGGVLLLQREIMET